MFIELYRKFLVSVLFVFLSSGFAQAARNSKSCGAEGVKGGERKATLVASAEAKPLRAESHR